MRLPFATTMINWFRLPSQSFPRFETGRPIPSMWSNCAKLIPQDFKGWLNSIRLLRERQQRIAALANQSDVHEREQAHIDAVARAAARAQQDKHFEQLAAQHIPNWESVAWRSNRRKLAKTLQNAGLSDSDIKRYVDG